jgi:hypothetical protein
MRDQEKRGEPNFGSRSDLHRSRTEAAYMTDQLWNPSPIPNVVDEMKYYAGDFGILKWPISGEVCRRRRQLYCVLPEPKPGNENQPELADVIEPHPKI